MDVDALLESQKDQSLFAGVGSGSAGATGLASRASRATTRVIPTCNFLIKLSPIRKISVGLDPVGPHHARHTPHGLPAAQRPTITHAPPA